jgi:hypothetical protein
VAEWLGRGLQNLVQRFESARYLRIKCPQSRAFKKGAAFFCAYSDHFAEFGLNFAVRKTLMSCVQNASALEPVGDLSSEEKMKRF